MLPDYSKRQLRHTSDRDKVRIYLLFASPLSWELPDEIIGDLPEWLSSASQWLTFDVLFFWSNLDIQAGKTHERAAEVREKSLKELTDAADSYVEASDAYRKDDPEAAIRCRERAFALIQQSTTESKQTRMSRVKEILGQIYEHDLKDLKKAREAYKEAAERLPKARELCVLPHAV